MILFLFWFSLFFIFYVYFGYGLILGLITWGKKRSEKEVEQEWPTVTILIAAYNEAAVIEKKLQNCIALYYPPEKLNILLVADGSTDQTVSLVEQFNHDRVAVTFKEGRAGKMAAINRAMPLIDSEIVLFSDANNMYQPDTLQYLIAPFLHDQTGLVGGVTGAKRILKGDGHLGDSEGLYWRYESQIKKMESRLGCCTGVAGEILAIRTDLFEPVPDTIINDDFFIGMRLIKRGYNLIYAAKAISYERVSLSAADEHTRRVRIVAGRYQAMGYGKELLPWHRPRLVWQIISHKFLRPFVPFGMLVAFLTNIWLVFSFMSVPEQSFLFLFYSLSLMGQLLFYLAAWMGTKVERKGKLGKILYLTTFLYRSNWAAVVGLIRFLGGQQTNRWARVQRRG